MDDNQMRDFTADLGFVVSFLAALLMVSFIGDTTVYWLLILLLLGMILLNSGKVISKMKG